jgi:hypothetical protein
MGQEQGSALAHHFLPGIFGITLSRQPKRPQLWKNSFFWFAGFLMILGVWGLVSGDRVIQDPGQNTEPNLAWLYVAGAAIMAVNGYLTHAQSMKAYQDETGEE